MHRDNLDSTARLLDGQAAWLDDYRFHVRIRERGTVVSVGDGIVWIAGLPSAAMDDILSFEDGSRAMVFDLTEDLIGAVLLHDSEALTAGTTVHLTGRPLSVCVGDGLLGRVIDPLGAPLDGGSPPEHAGWQLLESASPPIVARDFVHQPLYTGIKIIDTLIPIGKGQRQLIIGDEGLGRSSIAVDAVLNQRGKSVYCVYVLVRPEALYHRKHHRDPAPRGRAAVQHGGRGGSQRATRPAAPGSLRRLRDRRILDATRARYAGDLR